MSRADATLIDRLMGERIGGRFIVERPIGSGPLSTAFRARDETLGRRVTVKLFHPQHQDDVQVVDSQLNLATAVARLAHPNIATVIDRGEHDGMAFVVTEHVRGENLQERIDRFAPLPVVEVARIAEQVSRALAYAHAHDVCHGNVRPENVLIDEDREVKIVDFGGGSFVASLAAGDPYCPPELASQGAALEPVPESDIYALGVLLYVALTEHPPPPGGTDGSRIQLERPDISPRFAAVVAQSIAVDPLARPASMHEVASELGRIAASARSSGDGVGAKSESVAFEPAIATKRPRRERRARRSATRQTDTSRPSGAGEDTAFMPVQAPTRRRGRILITAMIVIPLLVLALVGAMLAGERGADQKSTPKDKVTTGAAVEVPIVGVVPFDPPPGDGTEHDELVRNISDDDPDSTWETEGYADASLNNKDGVGVVVTLDEAVKLEEMEIDTPQPGWTVEIFGAERPEPALEAWTSLSPPSKVIDGIPIQAESKSTAYRYFLVWITELPRDGDSYKAKISSIRAFGKP